MVDVEPKMQTECTAPLEALASEAYRTTIPAFFEYNLKLKYSDENNWSIVKCFDLIRDGVMYDLGRSFPNFKMGGVYMNELLSACIAKQDTWSIIRQMSSASLLPSALEEIVQDFKKLKT